MFILNIPLLAAGFIKFGGIFIAKTAVATAVMSLTLDISGLFMPKMKIDPILAALFGGLLMGLGISLFMLRGATTGGTDIIAKLINRKFPHLTVGRLMLAADAAVVGLFTIVQLIRNVQMLIPVYDFCIPEKQCDDSTDQPCDTFRKIKFPTDDFFPPRPCDTDTDCCGCQRAEQ